MGIFFLKSEISVHKDKKDGLSDTDLPEAYSKEQYFRKSCNSP